MALNSIVLAKWKSYFDRKMKPVYQGIQEYDEQGGATIVNDFENVNFNPNDGIDAELILNQAYDDTGDYLFVIDDPAHPYGGSVVSCWYVTESRRTRQGQTKLTLKRDVLADFQTQMLNAPCFVEKGTVGADNPLIYNREGQNYNQVKVKEDLIRDRSGVPWLVAYIAKNTPTMSVALSTSLPTDAIQLGGTLASWTYGSYVDADYVGFPTSASLQWKSAGAGEGSATVFPLYLSMDQNGTAGTWGGGSTYMDAPLRYLQSARSGRQFSDAAMATMNAYFADNLSAFTNGMASQIGGHTQSDMATLLSFNGKKVAFTGDNSVYRITVNQTDTRTTTELSGILLQAMKDTVTDNIGTVWDSSSDVENGAYSSSLTYPVYRVVATPLSATAETISIIESRTQTEDALYDMVAMPYGRLTQYVSGRSDPIYSEADGNLAAFTAIVTALADNCYDAQLLPYCPMPGKLVAPGVMSVQAADNDHCISTLGNFMLYYPQNAHFSMSLARGSSWSYAPELDMEDYGDPALNVKIDNECRIYRLCSPNYSGQFEFSVAKNGGSVTSWDVDCTYRPYNPYIHVAPGFGGLYGMDFNDGRGLTCGGDFGIGMIKDAWASYEIQNRNYQAIFDRQIQNMDVQNAYGLGADIASALGGTVQGAAAGALVGGVGGGIAGGLASGAAGLADIGINQALRAEQRDYAYDMHNLTLQNVKALPYSLSKTSALTANNKLFPFVETYSATDAEIAALENKIRWDGMTLGVIGALGDYSGGFVKGKILRLEDLGEDSHMAEAIYREADRGFYTDEL